MNNHAWRVLLVDDERSLREPLASFLREEYNLMVDTAASRSGAWQYVLEAEEPYDVALIDDMLLENETDPEAFPTAVGIDLMAQIKQHTLHTEYIIFTGWSGTERGIEALRTGAYRYMNKPFDHEELVMTIQMAAEHHQLRKEYELAEQQKKWLQTFIKVGQSTTSIRSFDEVLAEVHLQVGNLMHVAEMNIILYDEKSQMLHFELCYDHNIKQAKRTRTFDKGLTEWVISQKQPLLIKHYDKEKATLPTIPNIVFFHDDKEEEITQSYLGVPLIARNEVIGVINVQSYEPNQFDETDMYVLSAVASQVAVAISNAHLFSSLNEERERRQALLQSSLDAIVAIDNDKHITVFNKQAEKFFGRTEAEMLGKRTSVLFENVEVGRQIFDELNGGQSVSELQINFKHKNGEILPGKFSATVIKDEAGNAIGQAGFVRDLREINLLEARQRAWADVSQAVTMSQELDEILDLIMRSVTHIIPTATGGEFHLYKDGILQLAANTFHFSDEAISSFSLRVGEGIAGKVFETGKERIVKNTETYPQFKAFDHPEAPAYGSMICVPLQVQKQILGTLTLTSEATNAFAKANVTLLTPFASQAAIAIKNTQLLDEATKGLTTLKSISEASRNLISPQEPSEVLQTIVKQAKEVLQAWRASVILIGRDGSPHELAAIGYEHAPEVETVIRKKGGISARVIKSMEPCFIEDVTHSNEDLNDDMKRDGVLAAACLPLKLGEEAIGVMWVQYQQPHIFTPTEKEALIIYSEQAALAYDKTRQMQELQHMRQAADALAGAADLPEVLTQIVSSARTVLKADSAAIWSYDDIRKKFLLDYSVAKGIKPTIWNQFKQEEPKVGQTADNVMQYGSIVVENVYDHKRYPFLGKSTRRLLKQVGIESFQGIALSVGPERLGVLYVNYDRPRHFSFEEVETAATLAHHAALALKKARLLDEVHKAQTAARIVAQVTALENLNNTLEQIAGGTIQAMGCDAIVLYEYDQTKDQLNYPPKVAGLRYPHKTRLWEGIPQDNLVYKMLYQKEPYIVEDINGDSLFKGRRFAIEESIASCVAIPLLVSSVRVGVMFVNYRTPHRFTHEELQNIELFANQAAVAIRNAQLYEEVQERSKIRQALYKANEAISNSLLDEEATLYTILEQAVQITRRKSDNVGHACIREVENGISRLISVYPSDVKKKISQKVIRVSPEDYGKRLIGIMGRAALLEKPVRVGDVTKDADYREVDSEVRSELAVPFRLGNAVIVINVEHKEKDAYDTIDEEALKVLASQAAIAIENAQLYQKSETFREVAEALSSTNKLDDVLNVVIREAMIITNTHMGNITLWDTENEKASDALRVESDGKLHPYPSVARKNGNTRRIVDSRQALVIPDKRLEENPNPVYKSRGFLAEVGVPIENREKVLGVLYVRHPEPRHFSTRQVEMLKTLGKQAGVAIERAQTVGFIGNKTAVEWIQMASTAWGHSIKREVGIADGRLALLKAVVEQNNMAEFEAELINLKKVLNRIAEIPITAPLSYEDGVKAVPINDLLLTYLNRQWKHAQYKEISLKFYLHPNLDAVATVWASPEWLRRGFDLIVDNAVWAMKKANTPDPEISVTTCLHESQITITLENNGPSIPDEVLAYFRQEMAVPKKEGERGSGIGLQLTRTIFETYHGTMQINRIGEKGTEVVFTLPAYQPDKVDGA